MSALAELARRLGTKEWQLKHFVRHHPAPEPKHIRALVDDTPEVTDDEIRDAIAEFERARKRSPKPRGGERR